MDSLKNRSRAIGSALDTVPAHIVERVEVLYGGQGIFYGTQSVAGVVNIVTKSFSQKPVGSVSIGADENDAVHVNFDYRTSIGDHGFVVYASKDDADGFQPFATQEYQPSGTDRQRSYDVFTAGIMILKNCRWKSPT